MHAVTEGRSPGAAGTPAPDPAARGEKLLGGRGSRGVPGRMAGPVTGVAAMTGGDVPATALKVSDPASWDQKPRASGAVPHPVHGPATAWVHRAPRWAGGS